MQLTDECCAYGSSHRARRGSDNRTHRLAIWTSSEKACCMTRLGTEDSAHARSLSLRQLSGGDPAACLRHVKWARALRPLPFFRNPRQQLSCVQSLQRIHPSRTSSLPFVDCLFAVPPVQCFFPALQARSKLIDEGSWPVNTSSVGSGL